MRSSSLEYFENESCSSKKGDIEINPLTEVEGRIGTDHNFKFIVITDKKTLTIAATSAEQRDLWIEKIRSLTTNLLARDNSNFKEVGGGSAPLPDVEIREAGDVVRPKRRNKIPAGVRAAGAESTSARQADGAPEESGSPSGNAAPNSGTSNRLATPEEGDSATTSMASNITPDNYKRSSGRFVALPDGWEQV